jgi:hypothetical protein
MLRFLMRHLRFLGMLNGLNGIRYLPVFAYLMIVMIINKLIIINNK